MNRAREFLRLQQISGWAVTGLAAVFAVHFVCFYWWVSGSYYFSGDGLFYFSRRITSISALWPKFLSVDELFQYRPLPYVFFSFVLHPIFGTNPWPYHLMTYVMGLIDILLACGCCYFWLGRDNKRALIASVFLILNPVNFFPSYGLGYIDVLLSLLFYLMALIVILADTKWATVLGPAFTALALLSREHSVMLPVHALLILLATGVSIRQAISRTRNVWVVVAVYAAFQLAIRHGAVFAPEAANSNLKFEFSMERADLLFKGMKSATYFPESTYLNEFLNDYRRVARLAFVIPWFGMILWVVLRRDRVALSGLIWVPLSLLPIALIRFPPFPRHYYMAMLGLAVLFASVVRNARVMAYIASMYALVTLTSVAMFAQNSWIADGSRLTKRYFEEIDATVRRSGRNDFYVLDEGDRYFSWHVDGGHPVNEFLNRKLSFRFAASAPLPVDLLLSNSMNVVIPTWEGFHDALATGRFPHFKNGDLCDAIGRLTGSRGACAVFFRGLSVQNDGMPIVQTPNGLPIFELSDEIVTLSRTTVFLNDSMGIRTDATLRVARESTDGVRIQIYRASNGKFDRLFESAIAPGAQLHLENTFGASSASMFALRIDPGARGDETGDRVTWRIGHE